MVKIYRIFFIITAFYLCCGQSLTTAQEKIKEDSTGFKPNVNPELTVPKIKNNQITVDGVLNEPVWKDAALADNFTEIAPRNNEKPEVETKVYIAYDEDNIYFGFVCYEDMSTLRASMSDRDKMYRDDWVGPFIDTYNDQKTAFEFYVNPYGIQGDLIWTQDNESESPDFIYDSEARIYSDRWTAEIGIPFKSLRFPNVSEQVWRVHLLRNRPRGARQRIYWSSVSRDNPNFLGQAGILRGIRNVKGGKNLEILPYVLGTQRSVLENFNDPSAGLKHGKIEPDFGLGLKYGIASNMTLDLTFNPDFSQVEADAPQIDINSPFALFYTEKRPFFLEGADIFLTKYNVVYTRSINNPITATKLTGRSGKLTIGLLSAYDENTPFLVPLEERSFILPSNKNSLSNVLRLKYDLGGENYIGSIFSDREESRDSSKAFGFSGYNRVFGFDGAYNFSKNYYLTYQFLGYATKEINDTVFFNNKTRFGKDNRFTAAFDGESFGGLGAYLNFAKYSEQSYSTFSEIFYESPGVRRNNGFIERNNYMSMFTFHEYNFYPKGKIFHRIDPELASGLRFDTEGRLREQFLHLNVVNEFKNGMFLYTGVLPVNNEYFGGIFHKNVRRIYVGFETANLSKYFGFEVFFEAGKYIVRFANPSYVGSGYNFDFFLSVRPLDRLSNEISYGYSELSKSWGGEKLFAGYVLSDRLSFQFNKNFFLRVLLQYNSFSRNFSVDPLFSYKWNPFTILYFGSTHNFKEFTNSSGSQERRESLRQIFVKFQYLWRL